MGVAEPESPAREARALARDRTVEFAPPSIGTAEIDEAVAVLRSGWLTSGPRVERFERAFAEYVGTPHAVAVNSCTAALHLSLLAAGVGPGDEVVTTPLTFCATANVIVHTGATPVFADVDPRSMNVTPESVAAVITPRTRALLPVHFAGRPVDVAGFIALAKRRGLALVDDAAHAVESVSGTVKIGAGSGDCTCFSFYATKNLTTGEGGMVTTRHADWADRIRTASLHGMTRAAWNRYSVTGSARYDVTQPGFKYNMADLQAALGIHQLSSLERRLRRREAIWQRYDEALEDLPLERPAPVQPGDRHARHLYTVLVDPRRSGRSRDDLYEDLKARGVATSVHFTALHLLSYYAQRFNLRRGMFPVAEAISDRTLSLPLSSSMSDDAAEHVVAALRASLGHR
jgi:dTDP-4-amino-4,6-dideoxygalactose transaminase